MDKQQIINNYPSIFVKSAVINIDDDKLKELNTICNQIITLDLRKNLNVKEVTFRFKKICFELGEALNEKEDWLLHEYTNGFYGLTTKVINGTPICPGCENEMRLTQYDHDHPAHSDYASEYRCWLCDIRVGRFSGDELEKGVYEKLDKETGPQKVTFTEEDKMDLVKNRFENIDENDLVDGEQFFKDMRDGKYDDEE